MNNNEYTWTDNPTVSGVSKCDTDVLNDCLMHLKYNNKSGAGLELCDIGMALYVDESKGLRRYLNGQIVEINSNTQAFLDRLKQITTLYPSLLCTEEEWQADYSLNVNECVYKFVFNYADDEETILSVRLPKYPDYVEVTQDGILPVYGNELTLGLTNGSSYAGLAASANSTARQLFAPIQSYGTSVGSSLGSTFILNSTLGVTTDPTKSGLETNLKQTKLRLRYFIQIATGKETENNIVNDIELNNPYSFGDCKYITIELNNLSWLASNGQWNSKAVYPDYYDWILENVNNEIYGFKLFTQEYTDYDWVVNTTDETFRLPLKNHTSDDGNTELVLYYYVGETVQNANLIDAGRIGEQLATKTDMVQAAAASMPSDKYIDLTLGASGSTYTAPANGYVNIRAKSTTSPAEIAINTPSLMAHDYVTASNAYPTCFAPIKKGETFVVGYYNITSDSNTFFKFYYAEGSK